ncbi:MAG: hypothetical protein HC880_12830 [Bacteroidia bacterium]|nr:hypothetical protein [Bacteroidia bacterium]
MAFSCVVFILGNNFLVGLYIDESEVTRYALNIVIIAGFFQLSDGIQCTALGLLRGLEDVNVPTLISFFAYWIAGIPIGYFLAFHFAWDVSGVWIGLWMGLTLSAIFLTSRFYWLATRYRVSADKSSESLTAR